MNKTIADRLEAKLSPMAVQAIKWIAFNDNDVCTDIDEIQDSLTVALVSDIFSLKQSFIAQTIADLRKERDYCKERGY